MNVCTCANLDSFILHACSSKIVQHHKININGKTLTLHDMYELKLKIIHLKELYKVNIEMFLYEHDLVLSCITHLQSFHVDNASPPNKKCNVLM